MTSCTDLLDSAQAQADKTVRELGYSTFQQFVDYIHLWTNVVCTSRVDSVIKISIAAYVRRQDTKIQNVTNAMSKRGTGNYANASYQSRSKSGRDSFTVGNCLLWPGNAVTTWWVRFISRYSKMIYQMSPHDIWILVCLLAPSAVVSWRASPQREKLGVGCVQNVLHGAGQWK